MGMELGIKQDKYKQNMQGGEGKKRKKRKNGVYQSISSTYTPNKRTPN